MKSSLFMLFVLLSLAAVSASAEEGKRTTGQILNDATAAYNKKDYAKCGRLFAEAATNLKPPAVSYNANYNAACCFALAGDKDSAIRYLDMAVATGWDDAEALQKDSDLVSLHADSRWSVLLSHAAGNREALLKTLNREVYAVMQADQADRRGPITDREAVLARDHQRRKRILEIVEASELKAPLDYLYAALVLQHGEVADDFARAHSLALKALELDPRLPQAKWLAAATQDRYLLRSGKPQIYGTQYKMVDGKWILDTIDENAVTDEERARWEVPPLAEAKRRVERMNAKP
jgi:hypothetical protein